MGVTVNPCGNSTVGNIVAKFCGVSGVQCIPFMSIFDSCECWKIVCDDYNLSALLSLTVCLINAIFLSNLSLMF